MTQKFLNGKIFQFFYTFFISLKIFLLIFTSFFSNIIAEASVTSPELLDLINEQRIENDKQKLTYSDKLELSAQEKAIDILENDYFAHDSPLGISPWYWMEKNNYDFIFAGENLAKDFTSNKKTLKAWMSSETHRDNILNSQFKEVGIGIASGEYENKQTTIIVAHFGTTPESFLGLNENTAEPQVLGETKNSLEKINNSINIIYLFIAVLLFAIVTYLSYLFFIKKEKDLKQNDLFKPATLCFILILLSIF